MVAASPSITLFSIFATAFSLSLAAVPLLQRWGVRQNMLDLPGERKVHSRAVPRLGGIAICLAFLLTLLCQVELSREMRGMLAGALIIFVTGVIDDIRHLSPLRKLAGQALAVATAMGVGGVYIRTLGDLFGSGEILLPLWLALPFTLMALVGVANAFNLIDGLDGLAGGIATIALVAFALLAGRSGNLEVQLVCMALLGGMLGFLRYNLFPARIFMGDAGSLLTGFVIGFLALSLTQGEGGGAQPVVPLLVVGLPVADALRVMLGRLSCGRSPFAADQSHLHHQLLSLGVRHERAVLLICCASLFFAGYALLLRDRPALLLLAGYLAATLACYTVLKLLKGWRLAPVSPAGEHAAPSPHLFGYPLPAGPAAVSAGGKSRGAEETRRAEARLALPLTEPCP